MRLLKTAAGAFRARCWRFDPIDPDDLRPFPTISVWMCWVAGAACMFVLAYRPDYTPATHIPYILFHALLIGFNGYVHYRLLANRTVTWRWMLAMGALDATLATATIAVGGGFKTYFYLVYYPALAMFAVVSPSFRLSFAWVTVVAVTYTFLSVAMGEGLDLEAKDEKVLFARIAAIYTVVAAVNLVSRIERRRRREAVERERELQRERIELSQSIHDTTAQSAYMVGLGIDTAIKQSHESSEQLIATLEATAALSKSVMWELRHPIDIGQIFEGRELSKALRSHAETFTAITSVPTELSQSGVEPPLPAAKRGLLFSIAHNALTNALRHASARRIIISLEFEADDLRMSVSDDGVGLPGDYAERGHGFSNMRVGAERMGGRLEVKSQESSGSVVTCVIPYDASRGVM